MYEHTIGTAAWAAIVKIENMYLGPLLAAVLTISKEAPQGGVVRIEGAPAGAQSALLSSSKTAVPLFPASDGSRAGLVPVGHDVPPGVHEIRLLNPEGKPVHAMPVSVTDAKFPTQNIKATRAMKALTPSPGEMDAMRGLHQSITPARSWEPSLAPPVADCVNSPFGVTRLHNGKPSGSYHRGLDQASPPAAPIRAAASGQVKVARMFRMHGGTVGIDHGQGLTSHYLHMSKVLAKEGQTVKQGDVIGLVGSTGFATGPHLHWGLYLFAVPLNPRLWLPELRSCKGPL
jgi:murein DD-endopeptidase MepM/ murein hydrolase activator NlpD